MLKVLGFVRRNAKLTHDEYRAGHIAHHASFGRRLKNIRGYVLNVRANRALTEAIGPLATRLQRDEPPGFNDRWDGWGQLMFDSLRDYLGARDAEPDMPTGTGLVVDERVASVGGDGPYLYAGSPFQFHVDERVVVPVLRCEAKMFKLVQFVKCPPEIAPELFRAYWAGRYGSLLRRLPGIRGHVVNFRTSLDVMSGFVEPSAFAFTPEGVRERESFYREWDAIAETWFDDPEAFLAARAAGDVVSAMESVESELFGRAWCLEVDESVIVVPSRSPRPPFYYR